MAKRKQIAITEQQAEEIYGYLLNGLTYTHACARAKVVKRTWSRYCDRHPEYKERCERARDGKPNGKVSGPAKHPKALAVLRRMENGNILHVEACKAEQITVASFFHAVELDQTLRERYLAVMQAIYMQGFDQAIKKMLDPLVHPAHLKYVVSALAQNMPKDSIIPRLIEKQEVKADIEANVRKHKILDFS